MANFSINNGGVNTNKGEMPSIDVRFGPYASEAAAYAELGPNKRDVITAGLTVGITQQDGSVKEYWYQPDGNGGLELVEKQSSGGISPDMSFDQKLQTQANINNQESSQDGRLGYLVLQPEKEGDSTTTFAAQISGKTNTIFEIRDVFDLYDSNITIPTNCTLKFNGGMLKNGTLIGDNTKIEAGTEQIFDIDIAFDGTWLVEGISITNFGAKSVELQYNSPTSSDGVFDNSIDSSDAIQAALNSKLKIIVPAGNFYVSKTMTIPANASIIGCETSGAGVDGNYYRNQNRGNKRISRFVTDKYLQPMFNIIGSICIEDIYVDTADVSIDSINDTSVLVFNFDSDYANRGTYIKAYLYGNQSAPYNMVGYKFDCDKQATNKQGYITNLKIDGDVINAKIGVHVPKGNNRNDGCFRWATEIYLFLSINRARYHHLLESGLNYVISGGHQNGHCFPTVNDPEREHGMTHIQGASDIVFDDNCYYWDVPGTDNPSNGYYSHKVGILIVNENIENIYEFSYSICNVQNTSTYQRLKINRVRVQNSAVGNNESSSYSVQTINPVHGINMPSYIANALWDAGVMLDGVNNNNLFKYSLNVGSYRPNISYYSYENGNYVLKENDDVPIELSAGPLSGRITRQNIKQIDGEYAEVKDNSYIEYSLGYCYQSSFVIAQARGSKVRVKKVELYSGDTLKFSKDCVIVQVQSINTFMVATEFSNLKIRLYLENYSNGSYNYMSFSVALVTSLSRDMYINTEDRNSIKKGTLRLYHNSNPLSFVNTDVNPNGISYPYSIMYTGPINNRNTIVPSPHRGDLYFDTTLNKIITYKDSTDGWTNLDGSPIEYDMSQIGECEKKVEIINVSSVPSGGMLPNKHYDYGELDNNITFSIKSTEIDNSVVNTWSWQFGTPHKDIIVTFPSGLIWENGIEPTIEHSKLYTIIIKNDIASYKVAPFNATNYLRFTAKEAGATVGLTKTGNPDTPNLFYKRNTDSAWSAYTVGTSEQIVLSNIDDYVEFKGNNSEFNKNDSNYVSFVINNGEIEASGDLTSILNGVGGDVTLITNKLRLSNIFMDCTKLIKAPNLPSTTLTTSGYLKMFLGCTSLTESPVIMAKVANTQCFYQMFKGCTSLTKVCLYTENIASGASAVFSSWLQSVASSGIIECPPSLVLDTNSANGIPSNWTRKNIEYDGKANVTTSGSNVTNNNTSNYVDLNSAYMAVLTPDDGYTLSSVIVTMDDVDITAFVYNSGTVYIPAVTGNIVINATATQNPL